MKVYYEIQINLTIIRNVWVFPQFSFCVIWSVSLGGTVNVISLPQEEDWTPSVDASTRIKESLEGLSVRTKASADQDSLNTCQQSQADWIRQYMEQQEEVRK